MQLSPASELLSTAQVSRLLNLRAATVKKWRVLGTGPKFVRVGKRAVRYQLADVKRFIADSTAA
jgi:predicted DNA-binding transcriptional regulator AlpA